MSLRRTIDWSSALKDMRATCEVSPFLTATGKFDLRAIMNAAIADARLLGHGAIGRSLSWTQRLSIALKAIWAKAKRAVAAALPVRLAA
jgi:hypothetical protein